MSIGFYAGSFDPFTCGHLHIVRTASKIFDKVVVGIGVNPQKSRRYDKTKMQKAMQLLFEQENLLNCEVIVFDGLTADVGKDIGADFLIRGVRNGSDYDLEENLALINEEISGLDTVYLRAGEFGAISSSMVYELITHHKDASKYVPSAIMDCLLTEK